MTAWAIWIRFALLAFGVLAFAAGQGGGEKKEYYTSLSSLWKGDTALRFKTEYSGGTVLEGFICSDLIEIGGYSTLAPFGCITSNTGVLDGDGIAGFGPGAANKPFAPPPLPPVFLALANVSGDHGKIGTPVPAPSFAFLTSNHSAELQLGGIDRDAVLGPVFSVVSTEVHSYSIPIASITLGGIPILSLAKPVPGADLSIPGILDSGTTCICLPDSTRGGTLEFSPWQKFHDVVGQAPVAPLVIAIQGGPTIEIPYAVWKSGVNEVHGCVSKGCPEDRVVLGDWLFQSMAVVFGWAPGKRPTISIAKRNPAYRLKGFEDAHAGGWEPALSALTGGGAGGVLRQAVVRRVSMKSLDRLTFLVPASIGRPAQPLLLVFDTGSSFFGVRTHALASAASRQSKLGGEKVAHTRDAKAKAERSLFKLSRALEARRPKKGSNGPPWWAGALVALIGLAFFAMALVMAITRRRMSRGGGGKKPSFLVLG